MSVPEQNPVPVDWAEVRTVSGLPADEIVSVLQKAIRRGETEAAVLAAVEMGRTSPELEEHLWWRLAIIAAEDVGLGAPGALATIRAAREASLVAEPGGHDRLIFAAHCVRLLCEAPKDRTTSEMLSVVLYEHDEGRVPEVPDHALCLHTRRGKEMGRTWIDWLETGAVVVPEVEGRDTTYREMLRQRWSAELA